MLSSATLYYLEGTRCYLEVTLDFIEGARYYHGTTLNCLETLAFVSKHLVPLTHCSRETRKRVIGKQCRPRSDATERGV